MFCTNCGSEILPGQGFCTNCGEVAPGANAQAGTGYTNIQATGYVNAQTTGYSNTQTSGYSNAQTTGYSNTNSYGNGYSTDNYASSGYNNGYNTGAYNTGYATNMVAEPQKKGFPWLAVVLPLCLIGVIGGAFYYSTSQAGDSGSSSSPVAYSTAEPSKEQKPAKEKDEDKDVDKGSSDGPSTSKSSGGTSGSSGSSGSSGYSTMKKSDGDPQFAEVDEKGYADINYSDYYSDEYEFVTAYYNPNGYVFVPNGKMNDDTVIHGKRIGDFCDMIDSSMEGSGTKLNRDLFYRVLSADIIDTSMIEDKDGYLEQSLIYSLSFAIEFDEMDVEFKCCKILNDAPTRYYYSLSVFGVDDVWMVDYTNRILYMNKGTTEYQDNGSFAFLSDESLALWILLTDSYFDFEY